MISRSIRVTSPAQCAAPASVENRRARWRSKSAGIQCCRSTDTGSSRHSPMCRQNRPRWSVSSRSTEDTRRQGRAREQGGGSQRPSGGPSGPPRERRAVHAARDRQRVRGRHGRHGAQHPPGHRRAGLSSRRAHGGVVVHRRLWRDQGAHQLRRGPTGRPGRAEAGARGGLGHRDTGAIHLDVGTDLELDSRGECALGDQSGLHMVDHRDHEDRSRGQ